MTGVEARIGRAQQTQEREELLADQCGVSHHRAGTRRKKSNGSRPLNVTNESKPKTIYFPIATTQRASDIALSFPASSRRKSDHPPHPNELFCRACSATL